MTDTYDVGATRLTRLRVQHIIRYRSMLLRHKQGIAGIRPEEVETLLGVWESMPDEPTWDKLNPWQKSEVMDAIMDEEQDQDAKEFPT